MHLVTKARKIATLAHANQKRRDGVTPYIWHPQAVAERLSRECDNVIAAAWLHDVLEDTHIRAEHLVSRGIPLAVVCAVERLTKREGQSYEDYLKDVRGDYIARKVKIADMLSNLADDPTDKQVIKYAKGLLYSVAL